jgi:biotin carboxylase
VVKPVDGVSSWDVALAACDDDVRALAGRHLRRKYRRRLEPRRLLLFEEFLEGPLYSAEGFVTEQGPMVFGYSDRALSPPPCFVELAAGFAVERPFPGVDDYIAHCLAALGYDFGAFHLEFIATADGPRLVELNPRFIGGGAHQAIGALAGTPLGELVVAYTLGESVPKFACEGAVTDFHLVAQASGTVRGYRGLDAAARMPGCRAAGLHVAPGDRVDAAADSNSRWTGYVEAVGSTREDAHAKARAAAARITLDIEED